MQVFEKGQGRQLAVYDRRHLLFFPPMGLELGQFEIQQLLLGRLVCRNLERDRPCALKIADPAAVFHNDAGQVLRRTRFLDELGGGNHPTLGCACEMVVGEHTTQRTVRVSALKAQATVPVLAAHGAPLNQLDLPGFSPGKNSEASAVTVQHLGERIAAARAFLITPLGRAPETEPAHGVGNGVGRVAHDEPHAEQCHATGRPPTEHDRARGARK